MVSRTSAAAAIVRRLAAAAAVSMPAAWARNGPAIAPRRVAAASPVRKMALTLPRVAPGISRCMVVCGMTRDIDPNVPMMTAAGSAVASDTELNSRK